MLSNKDKETYSWQLDLPGFGINEQTILRKSTALVSRVGGMGGAVALSLAAAGIGKIIFFIPWTWHGVDPVHSQEERIVVAGNVMRLK